MVAYVRNPQTVPDDSPGGSSVRQAVADQNNEAIDDLYTDLNTHSNNEEGRSHADIDIVLDQVGDISDSVTRAEDAAVTAEEQADIATAAAASMINLTATSTLNNPTSISIVGGEIVLSGGYFSYTGGVSEKWFVLSTRSVTKSISATGVADGVYWVSENEDGTNTWFNEQPNVEWSETGVSFNITDGFWYDNNVLIDPLPSFIPNSVVVVGGEIQSVSTVGIANLVSSKSAFPSGLVLSSTDWANDGVSYVDADALGANPVAILKPNGEVHGSTDRGTYIKYPSGRFDANITISSFTLATTAPTEITGFSPLAATEPTSEGTFHTLSFNNTYAFYLNESLLVLTGDALSLWLYSSAAQTYSGIVTISGKWK